MSNNFLVFLSEELDNQKIAQAIANITSAKNFDGKLYIAGSKESIDSVSNSKSFKAAEAKEVVQSIIAESAVAVAEQLKGIKGNILFTDASQIQQLEAVSKVDQGESFTVYCPESSKDNKQPLANKLQSAVYHAFSGLKQCDISNIVICVSANDLKDKLNSFKFNHFGKRTFILELLKFLQCSLPKAKSEEVPLQNINKVSSGLIGSKFQAMKFGWQTKWEWMVGKPLRDLKEKKIDWNNGNDGIYRLILSGLIMLCAIVLPILSLGYGMTWDEPDNIRYAEDILRYFFSGGEDKSVFDLNKRVYSHLVNYGLFFDSFAALVNKITPFGIYETRHILNSLVGLIGLLFTALCARELKDWRTALIAFVFLLASPYYFGHSMNNPKDIPFAVGYIMSVYFIIRLFKQLPKPYFGTILWLTLSIAFVISIRIGGLLLTAYMGLFVGINWLMQVSNNGVPKALKLIPRYAFIVIGIAGVSYFLGLLPWPYGLQDPINNPFEALASFTKFSNVYIYEIFDGKRIFMNTVPWYYIPTFLLFGNPLYVLGGAAISLAILAINKVKFDKMVYLTMLFGLVFPIVYAIQGESTLYNGWRHFIFVYPCLVVMGAGGVSLLLSVSKNKAVIYGTLVVFGALLIKTSFWMVQNHPNQYVYYNEIIGGAEGAYGKYELDSYGNGVRVGLEYLAEKYPEVTSKPTVVAVNMTGDGGLDEDPEKNTNNYYSNKIHPNLSTVWMKEYEREKKPWDYALMFPRTFSPSELANGAYPPKGTIDKIEVDGVPMIAIVKRSNLFKPDGYKKLKKRDYAGALIDFEYATQYNPQDEEAWRKLAECYLNTGQDELAKQAAEKSIAIRPENEFSYNILGLYYMRQGKNNKAIEYFEKAIESKINFTAAYFQLGNLYLQKGNYELALKNLQYIVEKGGRYDPNSFTKYALACIYTGKTNEASKYLQYVLQQSPNHADAYQTMGFLYERNGDMNTANQYYQQAQALGAG